MLCLKVSRSRSRTNYVPTMLLIAALASACSGFPKPYPGYTRPELFFPTTARISEQLQQQTSASDIGFAVEAIDSSVARGSSSARLAILTYQQQSDPRQQTIDWLKSTGELLAGGAVFLTARDYLKGVGLFTGILVPELEKRLLWDMVLHVKNLQDRGLKEVEEIPEHGQLRRVVFFPRRALPSLCRRFPCS